MEDSYQTISSKQIGEGYYTEKRSKFLAFAHHVETVDEAMEIVDGYHKKYYDARHCCYAYMLGSEHDEFLCQRRWRAVIYCGQANTWAEWAVRNT